MADMESDESSNEEMKFEEIEGMMVPTNVPFLKDRSPKERIEGIKNLTLRDDDIFVCASPKCGTHWLWEIINVLLSGKMNKKPKETSMIDMMISETIDELESPRILNTHHPPHLLPKQIKEKKTRIVFIYRNPKDVAVSSYFHFIGVAKILGGKATDIAKHIREFPESKFPYNYFKYLKEFSKFLEENPDIPSITLTYEDLTYNPEANVRKLAEFIGVDVKDEQVKHVIDTCSFDNMKKADGQYKEKFVIGSEMKEPPNMYRKGKVGDWKNYFTVADSEAYDAVIENQLADLNIEFKFT